MDLTPAMLRYRECARHVWNAYFQPMPDGWHEFIDVERTLFAGLVLAHLPPRAGGTERWQREDNLVLGYWEPIAVVTAPAPVGLPAMHEATTGGPNTKQWREFRIEGPSPDLRFVEFFDFATTTTLVTSGMYARAWWAHRGIHSSAKTS